MQGWQQFVIGLAAFAMGGPGQAQDNAAGTAGTYIVERMETASALELGEDGRFRWGFSYGALDMMAEGRWRRDGDAIVLDTEPAVTPPRFEVIGTDTGRGPLTIRIEDESGDTPPYLDVVAENEAGERGLGFQEGDAFAFEPRAPRIVSVRLGSQAFGFLSEPFPVPAGTQRMRFRFLPNDLGRGDFRGARATIEGDVLLLPVLGEPLRYRRLSAEELAPPQEPIEEAGTETGDQNWLLCNNQDGNAPSEQAIAACTAFIEESQYMPSNTAVPLYLRGNWRFDTGDYDGAMADFDAAIALNPEYGVAYWGRADVYEKRGDFARAAAESRTAVRLDPDNPDVLNALCWHLALADDDLAGAREACDRGLAIRPGDPDTLDSRGFVGLRQARFREAWRDFDTAVRGGEGHPNMASFVYGRGIAALRLGRTPDGQDDLARAATLDANIAVTYARHGVQP